METLQARVTVKERRRTPHPSACGAPGAGGPHGTGTGPHGVNSEDSAGHASSLRWPSAASAAIPSAAPPRGARRSRAAPRGCRRRQRWRWRPRRMCLRRQGPQRCRGHGTAGARRLRGSEAPGRRGGHSGTVGSAPLPRTAHEPGRTMELRDVDEEDRGRSREPPVEMHRRFTDPSRHPGSADCAAAGDDDADCACFLAPLGLEQHLAAHFAMDPVRKKQGRGKGPY